jgi:asparagine synthase (glutamine-hydrolysing)
MCGIAGSLNHRANLNRSALQSLVEPMLVTLIQRGPDQSGTWNDEASGIALGHRRLSILDLTADGSQPMSSASERYVIVYNGEIYNYRDLKEDLGRRGHHFRGGSDTEVLLAAIETFGIRSALTKVSGMFAFGLWDREERTLTLARDRLGEKPLYYGTFTGEAGPQSVFASQLGAIEAHPCWKSWNVEISREATEEYFRYGYVPSPLSIYQGLKKLPPGHFVQINPATGNEKLETYWQLESFALAGEERPLKLSDQELKAELDLLLRKVVKEQMASDVPLGAFLSGGVDSSLVVSLMQAQSSRPVQTFSIGFTEAGFNEADHAKAVAAHLGTAHTELYVSPGDALAVIPQLATIYDEPFSDASQIPTFLVAQLAKTRVTVALSGDGGDESFAGYNRHQHIPKLWRRFAQVPRVLRQGSASVLSRVPNGLLEFLLRPATGTHSLPIEKFHKILNVADSRGPIEMYAKLLTLWGDADVSRFSGAGLNQISQLIQYLDLKGYLPDDILTKVDRAAMAVSLESRAPLADHRVVEFALKIPENQKIRGGIGKWILREVLGNYVPRNLVDRPKAGFAIPIGSWLRGDLRDWAENLLDPANLGRMDFLELKEVRDAWTQHLKGQGNRQHSLWAVLMFESWRQNRRAVVSS